MSIIQAQTSMGRVRLTPSRRVEGAWSISAEGKCMSYINPADPQDLPWPFLRVPPIIMDSMARQATGSPLQSLLSVGGAGFCVPRAMDHRNPGMRQVVLEPNQELTDMVLSVAPLSKESNIEVLSVFGQVGILSLDDNSFQGILMDAYDGDQIPSALLTDEFFGHLGRVLAPEGVVVFNVIDNSDLSLVGRVVEQGRRHIGPSYALANSAMLNSSRSSNYFVVIPRGAAFDDSMENAAKKVRRGFIPSERLAP